MAADPADAHRSKGEVKGGRWVIVLEMLFLAVILLFLQDPAAGSWDHFTYYIRSP